MLVFSTENYAYFADALCQNFGFERGAVEHKVFPDGESYHRLIANARHKDVALVGGTGTDADTLAVFDLGVTLVHAGARSLQVIIPYYGYSTMERAVRQGEAVKARTRAMLLSAIPNAAMNNEFVFIDLHSEGIPHYFSGQSVATHLYAKPVVARAVKEIAGDNFVLASTDAGRAKWVESLAEDLGVDSAFIYKKRLSGSETRVTGVNADVKGRDVVIFDDMIRTGGSLINAARAYKDAGAQKIYAVATHLLLPDGSLDKLRNSGLFEQVVGTDTHPRARELECDFLKIYSVVPIFGNYLNRELTW